MPPPPGGNTDRPDPSTASSEASSGEETVEDTTEGSPPRECEVPSFDNDAEPEPFAKLTATVVDQAGQPVADTLAQACGINVCLRGVTNASGAVSISGAEEVAKLAFKYGDGLHHAQVALLLSGDTSYALGEQRTVELPKPDPANNFRGGDTLSSGEAELSLEEDTEVNIDTLSYADESEHRFVAAAFDEDRFPDAASGEGFVSLWALGPAKTEFCPPARLSLPNTTQLPSEAEVDLMLLITDVGGRYGRYAEWTPIATARVTDDGARIVTDEGSGIPELGLIGVLPRE